MSDEEIQKDDLDHVLADVEAEAAKLETTGKEMIQAARLARDVVAPMRDMIGHLPSRSFRFGEIARETASWRFWCQAAGQLQAALPTVTILNSATSGAINTTMTTVTTYFPAGSPIPQEVQEAKAKLFRAVDRSPQADQARSSMRRLGLDARGGTARTALALLDDAQAALERPVMGEGSPTSVLVTLRESIIAAIAELLRRRRGQEETGSWRAKVESLGRHCGRPGLPSAHFERLRDDTDQLLKQLSGFKQGRASREEINERFLAGVTHFNALLDSIDESKLRV
jgi:hypothetical protein